MTENIFNSIAVPNKTPVRDDAINGMVTSIIYEDLTSNFKIFNVLNDHGNYITCKGPVPSLRTGIDVRCTGSYITHPRYGKQFQIDKYQIIFPTTSLFGLQQFLGCGMIEGVGYIRAHDICDCFKDIESIKAAMRDPEKLQLVNGIGEINSRIISDSYKAAEHMEGFLAKCFEYELEIKVAIKIYEEHKGASLEILEGTPYRLLEISGVSWTVIDNLAMNKLGIAEDDPSRISAAIRQGLRVGTRSTGDVFMYDEQLKEHVYPLLQRQLEDEDIETAATEGVISGIEVEDNYGDPLTIYYPTYLYLAETSVAQQLIDMVRVSKPLLHAGVLLSEESKILDPIQKQAVLNALACRVSVITGFPGSGKTFIEKIIMIELRMRGIYGPLLCAPTGRAAKQMEKSTLLSAYTIHRALGYNGDTFARDHDFPLEHRTVIVDEASMADINLFYHLLDAMMVDSRLLIIGDVDQLPSVGSGNVLSDIIDSGAIPYVRLKKIYRQGKGSSIPILSKQVNEYKPRDPMPDLPLMRNGEDIGFIPASSDTIDNEIRTLVKYTLPEMGFDRDDIQVLSPRKEGHGSVESINKTLREALNPGNPRDDFGRFRVDDRIMQIKNVYEIQPGIDVMNGDQGRVKSFSVEDKILTVDMEGLGEIPYSVADLKHLTHAYGITVHKSQGGQYPAVVLSILPEHGRLLYRSLLYTAITRAEQKLIIVGDRTAFAMAVRTEVSNLRQTYLMERLQDALAQVNAGSIYSDSDF